jgi:hypothetical protein
MPRPGGHSGATGHRRRDRHAGHSRPAAGHVCVLGRPSVRRRLGIEALGGGERGTAARHRLGRHGEADLAWDGGAGAKDDHERGPAGDTEDQPHGQEGELGGGHIPPVRRSSPAHAPRA